jgi:FkbM family methyltransferase
MLKKLMRVKAAGVTNANCFLRTLVSDWNSFTAVQIDTTLTLGDHSNMGWSPLLNTLQRVLEPLPVRGKGRLSKIVFRFLSADEAECHPLPSVTVHVRPEKWIERLMWAGAYERELVELFKRVLKPGMTVLDLGANIGYFSVLAAGLVGKSGQVYSFEPAPTCFAQLKKNLAAFAWAQAYPAAIADAPGTACFHFSDEANETGWGSLLAEERGSTRESVVPVIRLDDWARERAIGRVDFIKMDIEGGEFRALQGARELLERYRPVLVAELNEVCLARDGRQPEDVLALLRAAGYDNFAFNEGVLAVPREARHQIREIASLSAPSLDLQLETRASVRS